MKNMISFVCRKDDQPLKIGLEPEGTLFTVYPGNEIKFVPRDSTDHFHWTLSCDRSGIQLFPDNPNDYSGIDVYMNDEMIY